MMDEKVKEIDRKVNVDHYILDLYAADEIENDMKYLLSLLSTQEKKIKELTEAIQRVIKWRDPWDNKRIPFWEELQKLIEGRL